MVLALRLVREMLWAVPNAFVDWLVAYVHVSEWVVPYITVDVAILSVVKVIVAELARVDVAMREMIGGASTVVVTA